MLVEGGYLHTMKLLIERASETPDPPGLSRVSSVPKAPVVPSRLIVKSLNRLSVILLGWDFQA